MLSFGTKKKKKRSWREMEAERQAEGADGGADDDEDEDMDEKAIEAEFNRVQEEEAKGLAGSGCLRVWVCDRATDLPD